MNCPACNHELKNYTYKGVQLDECHNCHGIWFDHDELRKAKDRTDDDLRWMDFQMFEDKGNKYTSVASHKVCPKDGEAMVTQEYMHSKIKIDRCAKCGGIWLDHDEFKKIISYLEKLVITETASQYERDVLEQLREVFVGHENKISELKDFFAVTKLFEMRLMVEHQRLANVIMGVNIEWATLTGL